MKKIAFAALAVCAFILFDGAVSTAADTDELIAAWRILAEIELQSGKIDEALEHLRCVAALNGSDDDKDRYVATCLRYDRFEAARKFCREQAIDEPTVPKHFYRLAICCEGLGDARGRDAALEKAHTASAEPRDFATAADVLSRSKFDSTLRMVLEQYRLHALSQSEDGETGLRMLCLLVDSHLAAGDVAGAVEVCAKWKALFAKMPDCAGRVELVAKRCEAIQAFAQKKFKQAAEIRRELYESGESLYRLEIAAEHYRSLVSVGDRKAAQELFDAVAGPNRRAIKLDAADGGAHNDLAWLVALCGEPLETGLEHARAAVKGAPTRAAYLDTLAELLFQAGDYAAAAETMKKALGVHAYVSVDMWRRYARIRRALEKKQAA